MTKMYDIIVVGAGPVGLFAGYYASLRDANVLLLEAQESLGGQVATLYPDKKIWDVAGLAGETGRQLIDGLVKQAERFSLRIMTGMRVTDLVPSEDGYTLTINDGKRILHSKTVILATGKGAFEPRRLQVENEGELLTKGLSYSAADLKEFKEQSVAVLGGGDSAVDLAAQLTDIADKTYLIHRRNEFRALEQSVNALNESAVIKKTPFKVSAVSPTEKGQLLLTLNDPKNDDVQENLQVDRLVVQYGFKTAGQAERNWSVDLDWDRAGLVVNEQVKTRQPGVFAIGDLTSYPDHVDLIATGFGQAPAAVNAAIAYYAPGQAGPGHSSSLDIKD